MNQSARNVINHANTTSNAASNAAKNVTSNAAKTVINNCAIKDASRTKECFHCAEPILTKNKYMVEISGVQRTMCCPGCEAVARTIVENGLISYYQYRTATAQKQSLVPECLLSLALYDHPDIQEDFVHLEQESCEVVLSVSRLSCAACAWLIEKQLRLQVGVRFIKVNSTTNRATLRWDPSKTKLSTLLYEIQKLGYKAAPFEIEDHKEQYEQIMKEYLKKLGIAGLATMQVMMLAIAMYFDVLVEAPSFDAQSSFTPFFRWVSLIFATPVLLYSATPFYKNAWRNIKAGTLGMDIPVSIALLFSYFASFYATVTGEGEVYFESVAMFTFFLLIGRFLEMRAKRTSAAQSANLLTLIPKLARLSQGKKCAVHSLCIGDSVLVLPGESFPADGVITKGKTSVDESMLTGESMPVCRKENDRIFAGTINIEGHVTVKVCAKKKDALLNQIIRLQETAQWVKPRLVEISEIISRYFVGIILLLAGATWLYWHFHRPEDAFWIMLCVLVATCPCALSLATPTAITCAITKCNQWGILLRKSHVFETLTNVNHVIFDKTGTLTEGKISLLHTQIYPHGSNEHPPYSKKQIQSIACALESCANHPIAHAFRIFKPNTKVTQLKNTIGEGVTGFFEGQQWRIGKAAFALAGPLDFDAAHSSHSIWLSKKGEKIASFQLSDPVRQSSHVLIEHLKKENIKITMLTGDNAHSAKRVAKTLGIDAYFSAVSPQGKWDFLNARPKDEVIMMIGDGINDTPALAGAHLSVAMGAGVDAAKSSADMILLRDDLTKIMDAKRWAHFTQKIIFQNMLWALGYNVTILPLAMMGWIAPYIAVIGMSASSLIVVTNSLRLLKKERLQ